MRKVTFEIPGVGPGTVELVDEFVFPLPDIAGLSYAHAVAAINRAKEEVDRYSDTLREMRSGLHAQNFKEKNGWGIGDIVTWTPVSGGREGKPVDALVTGFSHGRVLAIVKDKSKTLPFSEIKIKE